MKKFAIFLVVVVGIAAAGFFWLSANLDGIVKGVVERAGTDATKTRVSLDTVDLKLAAGEASMYGLQIANPSGFEAENAVSLGSISVKVDTSTLNRDVIVIEEVLIDQPNVAYERKDMGSNLDALRKNLGSGDAAGDAEYTGPKFIIKALKFRDGHVSVSGVREEVVELDLPEIALRNIGSAEGGATPTEIGVQVTQALSSAAVDAVAKEGLNKMVGDKLDQAKDKIKGLFGN